MKRLTVTYISYANNAYAIGEKEEVFEDASGMAYGYRVFHFQWQGKYVIIPLKAIKKVVEEDV